jgi:hypothetical protein
MRRKDQRAWKVIQKAVEDRDEDFLYRICWELTERMSLDLDISHETCANYILEGILSGRFLLEPNPDNGSVKIAAPGGFVPN